MMSVFSKLRAYHAAVATLAIAAYATGETGLIHSWIGHSLAAILAARLLLALLLPGLLMPLKWLPSRYDLNLTQGLGGPLVNKFLLMGIVTSLLIVIASGVALNRGSQTALSAQNDA
jgi:hypothetical protein